MSGLKTNLKDLSSSFGKFKAMAAADKRREDTIAELIQFYIGQGKSPWLAQKLAEERYNLIHKHDNFKP